MSLKRLAPLGAVLLLSACATGPVAFDAPNEVAVPIRGYLLVGEHRGADCNNKRTGWLHFQPEKPLRICRGDLGWADVRVMTTGSEPK
jgi:hypothetical protein